MDYDKKIKKQLKVLKPQIETYLRENVSQNRFIHIENVAKTAKKYAKKLGLDHYKAELSGWLHDMAKELKNEKLLEIAKLKGIKIYSEDIDNPHLLHARVGAALASEKFGIDDPDVLGGIGCHTLADSDMSKISMVVYLADSCEPGRDRKFAAPIRKTFKEKGLEGAVLVAIDNKLLHVINNHKKVHPLTISARNWLLGVLSSNHKTTN